MPANQPPVAPAPPAPAAVAARSSYTFRKSDLPTLDIESDRGPLFRAWKRRWSDYRLVSGLDNEPDQLQSRVLRQCMSPETLVVLETLGVAPDDDTTSMTDIIDKLTNYADRLLNVNMEWHKLTARFQQDGEDINEFVMALRQLVKNCDTCNLDCADRAVRVQLIRGVKDQSITEALLKVRKITLKEAVDTAVALEEAQQGGSTLHDSQSSTSVNRLSAYAQMKRPSPPAPPREPPPSRPYVQRMPFRPSFQPWRQPSRMPFRPPWQPQGQPLQSQWRQPPQQRCPNCGGRPHTRSPCPAQNAVCDQCGKVGHFRRVCRSATNMNRLELGTHDDIDVEQSQEPTLDMDPTSFMYTQYEPQEWNMPDTQHDPQAWVMPTSHDDMAQINHISDSSSASPPSPRALIRCIINGRSITTPVLPDSGADISAASFDFVRQLGVRMEDIRTGDRYARAANGRRIPIIGKIRVSWSTTTCTTQDTLYIMSGLPCPLISWRAAAELDLIRFNFPRVNHIRRQPRPFLISRHRTRQLQRQRPPQRGDQQHDSLRARLQRRLAREFSDVLTDEIKVMKGEMFRIHLDNNATPFRVSAPRTVPLAYRAKLQKELHNLQQLGIIEPVTHPTDWCSPVVVEPKGEGVRLCVDFTKLNKFVKREYYHSDSPARQVFDILQSQAKFFTSLDATKGYHQCPLDERDRDLTTFITPFGRFRYLRAPFGISSISEHYNRRMDEALNLRPDNSRRVVDDLALYDRLLNDHYEHVRQVLLQCREQGITLNPRKFKFAQDSITFAGYLISHKGYAIDPAVHKAIDAFPMPANITDLRAFFGLVNQLTGTRNDIAHHLEPLRPLLSTKNDFLWTEQHTNHFQTIKKHLATSPTLAFFHLGRKTRLFTDASKTGVGFVLQQLDSNERWRVVYSGSRFLSETEQRYAIIELELLAICYAFRKCSHMITAVPVQLFTDHKPLIPILNAKRLDEIDNPRLRRMRFYLSQFQFTTEHCTGKLNCAADALSRFPDEPAPVIARVESSPKMSPFHSWVAHHMSTDPNCTLLRDTVVSGFPDVKSDLHESLLPFWPQRNDLWTADGLVFKGSALYIPVKCRPQVLKQLHSAHQGASRTTSLAKSLVYWPFLSRDVHNLTDTCNECIKLRDAPPKPPMSSPSLPTLPFQDVSMDVFQCSSKFYLAVVDAYSNWLELITFKDPPTSQSIALALAPMFATFGAPTVVRTDNASQFTSRHFKDFLKQFNVSTHITSAPYYAQSNGRAENAVKALKKLVKKVGSDQQRLQSALLMLRNTPSSTDGCSPAFKVFGRQLQCPLSSPANTTTCFPQDRAQRLAHASELRHRQRAKAERNYNKTSRPFKLPSVGSYVAVRSPKTGEFLDRALVISHESPRRLRLRLRKTGELQSRDVRQVTPLVPILERSLPPPLPAPDAHVSPAPSLRTPPSLPPPRRSSRVRRAPIRYIDQY